MNFLQQFWFLILESAPWLLAGYLLAGIIHELIPAKWIHQQLAPRGLASVVKGALIGAPLPLCSCGVIPAAVAIRKAGASKGSSASFLVATPETGVDSVAFSYAVLGPLFAIARPIAAIFSAITTGLLVNQLDKEDTPVEQPTASCCASKKTASDEQKSVGEKLSAALRYGYFTMIGDTAIWLLIGFIAAAAVTTWVPQSFFTQWGDGLLAMLIMIVIGLPMYICATASTPIAASFLFAGISPGAALVFMLTGPATNVATMGIVKQHLGQRSLFAYLAGVIGAALFCGYLLDFFVASSGWQFQGLVAEQHEHVSAWRFVAGIILSALVLNCLLRNVWKKYLGKKNLVNKHLEKATTQTDTKIEEKNEEAAKPCCAASAQQKSCCDSKDAMNTLAKS